MFCVDHTLNLAIKDTVDTERSVDNAIFSGQRLSEKTHTSHLANERIKQEILAMKWDLKASDESIVAMKKPLLAVRDRPGIDTGKLASMIPSEEDFQIYEKLLPYLKMLANTSERLRADKKPTLHIVIGEIHTLQHHINEKELKKSEEELLEKSRQFLKTLSKNLNKRFSDAGVHNMLWAVENILNPFYKGVALRKFGTEKEAFEYLVVNHTNHREWVSKIQDQPILENSLATETDPLMLKVISS